MVGSLFSSINSSSQIDKLLDNSALFKDTENASLENSNLDLIEKNIVSAKEGQKAVRVLDALISAKTPQNPNNTTAAGSMLSATSYGLLSSRYDGPFDNGYGDNGYGNSRFGGYSYGYSNSGYNFASNIFKALI